MEFSMCQNFIAEKILLSAFFLISCIGCRIFCKKDTFNLKWQLKTYFVVVSDSVAWPAKFIWNFILIQWIQDRNRNQIEL